MPNGPLKITGLTFDEETVVSECQIEDEDLKVRYTYNVMYTSFSKYFNFQNHSESMNFSSMKLFLLIGLAYSICVQKGCQEEEEEGRKING